MGLTADPKPGVRVGRLGLYGRSGGHRAPRYCSLRSACYFGTNGTDGAFGPFPFRVDVAKQHPHGISMSEHYYHDREPPTPRTPYTRLEQELICLRRDYDQTRARVATMQRLLDALSEQYPVVAGMSPQQLWGARAGIGSALIVLAVAITKLALAIADGLKD